MARQYVRNSEVQHFGSGRRSACGKTFDSSVALSEQHALVDCVLCKRTRAFKSGYRPTDRAMFRKCKANYRPTDSDARTVARITKALTNFGLVYGGARAKAELYVSEQPKPPVFAVGDTAWWRGTHAARVVAVSRNGHHIQVAWPAGKMEWHPAVSFSASPSHG